MAPIYEYQAISQSGRKTKGVIEADNLKTARTKLKAQQLMVVEMVEKKSTDAKAPGKNQLSFFSGVGIKDITLMTKQLSNLVRANIPLVEALSAVAEQTENRKLSIIMTQVRQDVNEGLSLAKALGNHPRIFDRIYVSMIESGESSGNLSLVLKKLSELKDAQLRLLGQIRSATTYPALMMVVSFGLVLAIFTFVIPKMAQIFESSKRPIPWITRFLIQFSEIVVNWWWAFILVFILALFLLMQYIRTPSGKAKWDVFLLRLPVVGNTVRLVATTRFCSTMGTLLASGVPILTSLQIAKSVVDITPIANAIQEARDNITEGQSIAEPLRRSGEFPVMMIHMISTGERTGDLPPMLETVASIYEQQVAESVETFTGLLEPLMIIFMGGVVFIVAVAVLLPMLDMMNITQR